LHCRVGGGFETLLLQEIADITDSGREPHNLQRLSPAICPDCATGNSSDLNLTMAELYSRADLVCSHGITDWSGFTFFEIALKTEQVQGGVTLGNRYMEALAYFRTGQKGLIIPAQAAAPNHS
jgi:hypothetical protein